MKKQYATQYERMTEAPVGRLVLSLGLPTTISMLVTNIYNLADTFFVGRLGTSASGAVGIVFGFMAVLQAFGFMYGQGAGSIISRKLGEKDSKSASVYASTGFFLAFGTGAVILVLGMVFIVPLMWLLGSTKTIFPYAKTYIFYILLAAPFMTSSFLLNNILRYEGKAYLAMVGLLAGALLNIGGDPFFMFVLHMDIAGAGLSTALSQIISFFILLSMFLRGRTQSKIRLSLFSRRGKDIWEIVATGFPSMARQGLTSVSTMVLNQQAGLYGDAAVAAMSIVSRINMLVFSVGLGIGQGFQPVSGFNFGARKYDRLRKAYLFTVVMSECIVGVLGGLMLLFSPQAVGIFRDDPDVIRIGTIALQMACVALLLQPLTVTTNMLYQSTGQKAGATFLSVLRSGLYFIPILLLATRAFGLLGIQMAQPLSDVLTFLTTIPFAIRYFHIYTGEEPVKRQDDHGQSNI